jgi:hypothetical protein
MSHPHPYTIGLICQGSDLHVIKQCCLSYEIKPFNDKVLCHVSHLEVCNVILGQTYLWKYHDVYESRTCSVIITLNMKLYRMLEEVPPSVISLIISKKCRKVISQIGRFVFFFIHSQSERKIATTSISFTTNLSTLQNQVEKVMAYYKDTSPHLSGYLLTVRSRIPST